LPGATQVVAATAEAAGDRAAAAHCLIAELLLSSELTDALRPSARRAAQTPHRESYPSALRVTKPPHARHLPPPQPYFSAGRFFCGSSAARRLPASHGHPMQLGTHTGLRPAFLSSVLSAIDKYRLPGF